MKSFGFESSTSAIPATRALEDVLTRMMFSRAFGYLTPRRRTAVIQALELTVAPPRKPERERIWLRWKLLQLPWAWELDDSSDDGLVQRDQVRMVGVKGPRQLASVAHALSGELEDVRLRRSVYRLMVALIYVDGGTDLDVASLDPVRAAFELPPSAARRIEESLRTEARFRGNSRPTRRMSRES